MPKVCKQRPLLTHSPGPLLACASHPPPLACSYIHAILYWHATVSHSTLTLTHRLKTSGSKRLQDSLLANVGKGEEHRTAEAARLPRPKRDKRPRADAPLGADELGSAQAAPASASEVQARGGKKSRDHAAANVVGDSVVVDDSADTAMAPAAAAARATTPAVERLASSLEGFMTKLGASSFTGSGCSSKSDAQESPMYRAGSASAPSSETELADLRERLRVQKENGEAQQRVRASIALLPLYCT